MGQYATRFLLTPDVLVRSWTVVRPRIQRRLATSLFVAASFCFLVPGLSARQAKQQAATKQARPAAKTAAKKAPPAVAAPSPTEQKIQKIENGLVPAFRVRGRPLTGMTLAARMKKYHVQGVSI